MQLSKHNFILLFLFLLFVFYPELFLVKSAALMGDHIEQHYPWAHLLASSLKSFQFPMWTRAIHCGFPIAAEGQMGVFYLPNIILSFLLPIRYAYSYTNIIHFFIAGYATFLYARTLKLGNIASFFAAIIFVFGGAYGGAYYNIISLKTICWFPVTLFFFEQYYLFRKPKYLAFISISLALSILAGYLQVAALMIFVLGLYVFLRTFCLSDEENRPLSQKVLIFSSLTSSILLSIFLALPQLWLTFQLAIQSNRLNLTENYAYIGSMSPLVFLTLLFPNMQGFLWGNSVYCGIMSVFFILCAFFSKNERESVAFKIWLWIGILSLLLALGQWSPFYVALIKLTGFYSFRIPAKFIVFICFSLAIIAGLGVQSIEKVIRSKPDELNPAKYAFSAVSLLAIASQLLIYYLSGPGQHLIIPVGKWFIHTFTYGQIGHPYSIEIYYDKLKDLLASIHRIVSPLNFWNLWTYFLFVVVFFVIWSSRFFSYCWLLISGLILIVDLYGYAYCDIKKDFATYNQVYTSSPVIEMLQKEKLAGQLGRIYGYRVNSAYLPLVPSINMLYGIEDIGAYSPFVLKRYYETIGLFGNVNDSNFSHNPSEDFLNEHLNLLNILDVSHILSDRKLKNASFELQVNDKNDNTFLYKNKNSHTRAFFVSQIEVFDRWEELKIKLLEPGFNPKERLLLEKNEIKHLNQDKLVQHNSSADMSRIATTHDSETWSIQVSAPGFFVVSNTFYPGWKAYLNNHETPILKAYGLFQCVWIENPGAHEVTFKFFPFKK